jgi:hypothetical protein
LVTDFSIYWPTTSYQLFGALDWTRTSTPIKALPPQDSVSTNSTTRAFESRLQIYDAKGELRKSKCAYVTAPAPFIYPAVFRLVCVVGSPQSRHPQYRQSGRARRDLSCPVRCCLPVGWMPAAEKRMSVPRAERSLYPPERRCMEDPESSIRSTQCV